MGSLRDYITPAAGWGPIEFSSGSNGPALLAKYGEYVADNPNFLVVLGYPMYPNDSSLGTIPGGATGAYTSHFTAAANAIVAAGLANNVMLCPGYEYNAGSTFPWGLNYAHAQNPDYSTDKNKAARDFASSFQYLSAAFKSVSSSIKICLNPINGWDGTGANPTLMMPDSTYYDYVGVDLYDASFEGRYPPYTTDSWAQNWAAKLYGGSFGMRYWEDKARIEGKGFALPEWGVFEYGTYDTAAPPAFTTSTTKMGGRDNSLLPGLVNARLSALAASGMPIVDCYFNYNEPNGSALIYPDPSDVVGGQPGRNGLATRFPNAAGAYQTLRWGNI